MFKFLPLSYLLRKVSRETLRDSAASLLAIRSSLGMFAEDCPYDKISPTQNATAEHEAFAVTMAEKGLVLLENHGALPLKRDSGKILVVGYNAENDLAYLGNYFGDPTSFLKIPQAIREIQPNTDYAQGYSYKASENVRLQIEALEKAKNARCNKNIY